jgi:hypothetical protein
VSSPTAEDLNPTEKRSDAWTWVVVLLAMLLISVLINIVLLVK